MKVSFNHFSGILGIILGTTFLISSSLKSVSADSFSEQIGKYGVCVPEFLSPIIIITEALLGIVLILGVWRRYASAISAFLLIVFTLGYTYGLYHLDISDCGCFGDIRLLNSSPLWLYFRNSILLAISIVIFYNPGVQAYTNRDIVSTLVAMIIGGSLIAYLSGLSSQKMSKQEIYHNQLPIALSASPLKDVYPMHPDSTYLVFAFSYTCPHCLNSIANLNEYERLRVVDKVIGATRSKAGNENFNKWFSPRFPIVEITPERKMISNELPTLYYIRNDSIVQVFQGEIPCAFIFKNIIR